MPYLLTRYPLDDLYLGPDEDIEYDFVSSGSPDVLAAMPGKYIHSSGSRITMHAHSPLADQSPVSQADHPGFLINPDLYLRPEDDAIDVDELPDSPDRPPFALAPSQVSMSCEFLHSRRVSIPHVSPKRTKHLPTLVQSSRSSLTKIYMRWSRSSDPSGHTITPGVSI